MLRMKSLQEGEDMIAVVTAAAVVTTAARKKNIDINFFFITVTTREIKYGRE